MGFDNTQLSGVSLNACSGPLVMRQTTVEIDYFDS